MYTETNKYNDIVVHLEEGEKFDTLEDALCAVFHTVDDSIDVLNEGFPICLGNSYARYEFTAFVDGLVFTFSFGPSDYRELCNEGKTTLFHQFWNELSDMPDWIRPEWAE